MSIHNIDFLRNVTFEEYNSKRAQKVGKTGVFNINLRDL